MEIEAIFFNAIIESGLLDVQRLPKNCQATHVIKILSDSWVESDLLLPIKLCIENASQTWDLSRNNKFQGVKVLWMTIAQKLLIYDTVKTPIGQTTSERLLHSHAIIPKDHLVSELVNFCKTSRLSEMKAVLLSREESILRPRTGEMEAHAHEEIQALLGEDHFEQTTEKCTADAGYHRATKNACLAVQTKNSSCGGRSGQTFGFQNTTGYDGMILFLRPMTRLYIGTFIMIGLGAPASIGISLTLNKSKYLPFLVGDTQLNSFMSALHEAVMNGKKTFKWPSGIHVDISSLRVWPFDELCKPVAVRDAVERQSDEWRQTVLPSLTYELPKFQGTTVDTIINGARIQGKHMIDKPQRRSRYSVLAFKNAGRRDGKATHQPYEEGDFDAICVYMNTCKDAEVVQRYFFILPSFALLQHNILKSATCKGRSNIVCYLPGYQPGTKGQKPNMWTQQYCFDVKDPEVENKVAALLAKCLAQ